MDGKISLMVLTGQCFKDAETGEFQALLPLGKKVTIASPRGNAFQNDTQIHATCSQALVLSHSGASPGGSTIRLAAVASECIAAMSTPSNSKLNTARFCASRSIRAVLESATIPRC